MTCRHAETPSFTLGCIWFRVSGSRTRFNPHTLYLLLYTGRLGFDYNHLMDKSVPKLTLFWTASRSFFLLSVSWASFTHLIDTKAEI